MEPKNAMMEEKMVVSRITIKADAAVIWNVLVNPAETKKYMFGCETVSDWKPGSPLLWRMEHEGKELVAVKGSIVEIDPPRRLVYTVFDPNNAAMEDIPANYLTVSYDLTPGNGETILTVTQGDYNTVADGEKRYREAYNNGEGWNPILVQIRDIAEGG